jgi:GH25 family lysozyme M1 (1,4-beta-N-acetylmuramidase)
MKKIFILVGMATVFGYHSAVALATDSQVQESSTVEQTSVSETSESVPTNSTTKTENSTEQGTATSSSKEIKITESNNAQMGKEAKKESEFITFDPNRRSDLAITSRASTFSSLEAYISANDKTRPAISFIDVSSHNGEISVSDYNNMKNYGVKGVVVKLTEYTTYVNPYAKSQIENAKKAGLAVSVYHYSWFSTPAMAEAEADFFAAQAVKLGLSKNTVMVNDAEQVDMTQGNVTSNSVVFKNRLNSLGFNRVAHYSMFDWFNRKILNTDVLGLQNSWVAQYPYNPLNSNLLHTNYAAWQWSSEVTFPSVNTGIGGRFDVNIAYNNLFLSANDSYDVIQYEKAVNFKAKVKTGMNHGIYGKIYNTEGDNPRLASSPAYEGKDVEIVKEAKTARATWYQFKVNGQLVGWMDASGFDSYDEIQYEEAVSIRAKVKAGQNHGIYGKIYYTEGNNPRLASSTAYEGKDVEIVKEAKTVKATWYQFKLDGKIIGWMDAKGFENYDTIEYEKAVNFKAKIQTKQNHGIYGKIYYTEGNNPRLASSPAYEGKDVEVVKEAKTVKAAWYQFKLDGKVIGWMDAKGFDKYDAIEYEKAVSFKAKIQTAQNHGIYGKIYYTEGNNPRLASSPAYEGKTVEIVKEAKTVKATWYQFKLNGKVIGWMDAKGFDKYDAIEYEKAVSFRAKVQLNQNHGIYGKIYYTDSSNPRLASSPTYEGKEVEIVKEAKTVKATWYQFKLDGKVIGWMDAKGFDNYDAIEYEKTVSLKGKIKTGMNHGIYGKIYYTQGNNPRLASSPAYENKTVEIVKEAKTVKATWYQFKLNGKVIGWMDAKGFDLIP